MEAQALSWPALEAEAERLDAAALASPDIDRYCSSSLWALPAHKAFAPDREPRLFRCAGGYLLFAEVEDTRGLRVWQPLEPVWGLGCPLVGEPEGVVTGLRYALREHDADAVLVTGLGHDGPTYNALVQGLGGAYRILQGHVARRYVASLEGGVEGFLSRRPRSLKKALRRGTERARELGVSFERAGASGAAAALYDRILGVEAQSWKGLEGTGLAAPEMEAFYADQLPRLVARRALRLIFAVQDGRDVGFILGGILGDTYRGLQFSYADRLSSIGLGSLLQLTQIEDLCREGVRRYDLGSDVAYKQRWGESTHDTVMLALVR